MAAETDVLLKKLKSRVPLLSPKKIWDKELNEEISKQSISLLAKAALYLWNDCIEGAHKIAQENPGKTGDLIHATLHRRQGDYWNSKYWYSNVGSHPIYKELKKEFEEWEPKAFVDWVEAVEAGKKAKTRDWLEKVQAKELELLAEYCLKEEGT